jgi:hypothetical protein
MGIDTALSKYNPAPLKGLRNEQHWKSDTAFCFISLHFISFHFIIFFSHEIVRSYREEGV